MKRLGIPCVSEAKKPKSPQGDSTYTPTPSTRLSRILKQPPLRDTEIPNQMPPRLPAPRLIPFRDQVRWMHRYFKPMWLPRPFPA